ncbi:MAG: amidase [Chloroflexi bacterium]|nr:amidase [Chloroflexota bacterium]
MPSQELCSLTLAEVAPLLQQSKISPVELTQAYLDQIAALNPTLNAFLTITGAEALAAARQAEMEISAGQYRGPLHGVPIALKDLFDTAGVPTTGGTRIMQERIPAEDATTVKKMRNAGGIILGKLNLHECAYGITTVNPHFGACHNPWDTQRICGGSSGGSGAALAAEMCLLATGTDTGGSIRIPAALCGTVGIKPTYGRVSAAGVLPLCYSLDHPGPMARRVWDTAAFLGVMAGYDPADPATLAAPVPNYLEQIEGGIAGLKIGFDDAYARSGTNEEVYRAFLAALEVLRGLGVEIVPVSNPWMEEGAEAAMTLLSADATLPHRETMVSRRADYGIDVITRLENGLKIPPVELAQALRTRQWTQRHFAELFAQIDLWVTPMSGITAPPIDQVVAEVKATGLYYAPALTLFTRLYNLAGVPALALPCGFDSQNLPVGLQIVGPWLEESLVLRAGYAYEQATAWHKRRPPLLAGA